MRLKIICCISLFLVFIIGGVYANTMETSSSKITADLVNVQLSDTSSQVIAQLKAGESINVLSNSGKLIKINYGDNLEGYIDSTVINGNSNTNTIAGLDPRLDAIVKLAWSKVGSGRDVTWNDDWTKNYYTCNGFITYLYLHIYDESRGMAINLPCNGITQDEFCTVRYNAETLRNYVKNGAQLDDYLIPGDVVYFHGVNWNNAGHVEIYVGNDQTIGATGSRPDSVRVNNARELLLSGKLITICRIIDGNSINTETPRNEIRPLRKFPAELNINLYDYDALQRQGVTVVEDNAPRNSQMR